MTIRYKKLTDTAHEPTHGLQEAAGCDLYADIYRPVTIQPHQTVMIATNVAMEIPQGYFGAVYARSGLATRSGLRPGNCVGVIDSDYRGSVNVGLHNDSSEARIVRPGERIAQIVIQKHEAITWQEAEELTGTKRGSGGFGSTGR